MFKTTDNNCGKSLNKISQESETSQENEIKDRDRTNLQKIANKTLNTLISSEDNPNLLVFPQNLEEYGDEIGKQHIFSLHDQTLTTGNIMGFIGVNNTQLSIRSRFAKDENNDYFLHYMLQKVFSINLFDLEHRTDKERIFDFLLYLFPFYLKKALGQGLYKEYQKEEYNDANIRGPVDVTRHIKRNIPFNGKIAYQVREHSYDNNLTQLIRHTIECIKTHKFGSNILTCDSEMQNSVRQIIQATPRYEKNKRVSIINKNIKPFSHPYFYEYKELQKICLQILRHEGLKYGETQDDIYGVLFDGAWLWEEYLNTFLKKCEFKHPKNKTGENPIYLFKGNKYEQYPDFWKEGFVLDAKYKRLNGTNDMHQIISYMYILKATLGGFIHPLEDERTDQKKEWKKLMGQLNGYGADEDASIHIWTFYIPQQALDFENFCRQMADNEEAMTRMLHCSLSSLSQNNTQRS